ncbi:hypothetical protein FA13DRAFT_1736099 [Coprinellus micaceus]|uniref:GTP binding protein 2 n=1 Tax=Coprinellus micaceus TaxID=71717 RepID=A0A4Y7T2S4_COPMI|nr:hypothetical protein FA13DRAFT_1736099 [Coprinellus micaceus]
MFGESESESPRVPSPWDPLIASASVSPSPAPSLRSRAHTPSPLSSELAITLPRLVPESDDGNVEYKLQLLNPSPARFARLVTQLKWRLLEGGGQAYYELGVADSGDLVGLSKEELEQTLETLEMMAGEIGASVIVVKEVEIPAALAKLAKKSGDRRRLLKADGEDEGDDSAYSSSNYTETTEGSRDASDDDLSSTVILDQSANSSEVFTMDEMDTGCATAFAVDLEISSVFKPRPVRTRAHNLSNHLLVGGKSKRGNKKLKFHDKKTNGEQSDLQRKAQNRRENRDKKREEKRKALVAMAAQSVGVSAPIPVPATTGVTKVLDEVAKEEEAAISTSISPAETAIVGAITTVTVLTINDEPVPNIVIEEEDDDVFGLPSPVTSKLHSFPTFASSFTAESHLDVDPAVVQLASATARVTIEGGAKELVNGDNGDEEDEKPRLIVEALVVRKMSLEEGFLDFGGFAIL